MKDPRVTDRTAVVSIPAEIMSSTLAAEECLQVYAHDSTLPRQVPDAPETCAPSSVPADD
jgi:hypothetical protein